MNILELKYLSKRLLRLIDFIPKKTLILSNDWKHLTIGLPTINFNIQTSIEHNFFVDASEQKLYILWNYEKIDYTLKEFLKTLNKLIFKNLL